MCKKPEHQEEDINKIYCEECNRFCYNCDCKENHSKVCEEEYKSIGFNNILLRSKEHICGNYFCKNCKYNLRENEHQWYMKYKQQRGGKCEEEECICNTTRKISVTNFYRILCNACGFKEEGEKKLKINK